MLNSLHQLSQNASRWGMLILLPIMILSSIAPAADIPVETEGDYQRLLDAIRATEYTRQGYLEENANPRMVAAVSGLWAFSDRNPFATPEQLSAFVAAYDDALAQIVPGDERLISPGSLLTAVNAARVASEGVLSGTDTRVSADAMRHIGIALPGLESFEQSQNRMARFDVGSVQRWINRSQTADILTALLAGVSPSGERVVGLETTTADYLESMGFTPMLGMVDPDQPEVNAGLTGLPDFAGFIAIRDVAGAHVGLETEVFSRIEDIQLDAEARLDAIGNAEIPTDMGLNSIDLFAAAADPDHPDHADAVAQLEARRQAVVDSIRETTDDRAAVFARTMLLQQSSYPDVQYVAENTRSFAGLQLQVNNDLAVAQQSLGIVGSLAGLGGSIATGNVYGGVASTASLISGVLGLVDLLGDGPPSADQQIFDQIAGLRQQVEDLRVQMNARFDIVDAKLDTIFDTMVAAFDRLQDGIDTLIADITSVRSSLDRIEAALYGFAQNLLLVDLTTQTDSILDYRTKTGFDLAYADQSPSFVGGASGFTTFATFTAQTSSFAGPENNQSMILTLDNAADVLSGPDDVVSRLLNDFRRVPPGLVTVDGVPVTGPIITGRAAAPAPWSQAAAAYAQLARENPWYFAYMLRSQQDSMGGDSPQIDQIIAQGDRIRSLANATRDREDLFDALLTRAGDGIIQVQTVIDDAIDAELAANDLDNGTTRIDPWGPVEQTATPLVNPVVFVTLAGDGCFDSPVPFNPAHITTSGNGSASSFPHDGFEASISDNRTGSSAAYTRAELAERNALDWRLRTSSTHRPLVEVEEIDYLSSFNDNEFDVKVSSIMQGSLRSVRTIRVVVEVQQIFNGGDWGPPNPEYNVINGNICEMVLDHWLGFVNGNGLTLLFPPLQDGDLVGEILPAGEVILEEPFGWPVPQRFYVDARFRVISDTSTYTHEGTDYLPIQSAYIADRLADIRDDIRQSIFDDINAPPSLIDDAFTQLDNTSALLDGYLTLGVPDALNRGEALRSAFRGVPSSDGIGFRSGDVISVLADEADADDGSIGGAPGLNLPDIEAHFTQRIGAIASEIDIALDTPAPSFPYVEFMIADLSALVENAFDLAADDTYLAERTISPDASGGLMANDVGQPGRIDNEDLMVDLDYFASPDHTAPANGSVSVNADGSFTYTPDPGFEGTDSFDYRLVAEVGDPDNPVGDPNVYSETAEVVLRVSAPACVADYNGDGVINFFDVSAFLVLFGDEDPAADLNADNMFNFFDVAAFLALYNQGCP
ncbi:MAG: Ig-like domain-containing protein [bacterium]|nr:Ig-like domain-containing protein [bacterium]